MIMSPNSSMNFNSFNFYYFKIEVKHHSILYYVINKSLLLLIFYSNDFSFDLINFQVHLSRDSNFFTILHKLSLVNTINPQIYIFDIFYANIA